MSEEHDSPIQRAEGYVALAVVLLAVAIAVLLSFVCQPVDTARWIKRGGGYPGPGGRR